MKILNFPFLPIPYPQWEGSCLPTPAPSGHSTSAPLCSFRSAHSGPLYAFFGAPSGSRAGLQLFMLATLKWLTGIQTILPSVSTIYSIIIITGTWNVTVTSTSSLSATTRHHCKRNKCHVSILFPLRIQWRWFRCEIIRWVQYMFVVQLFLVRFCCICRFCLCKYFVLCNAVSHLYVLYRFHLSVLCALWLWLLRMLFDVVLRLIWYLDIVV